MRVTTSVEKNIEKASKLSAKTQTRLLKIFTHKRTPILTQTHKDVLRLFAAWSELPEEARNTPSFKRLDTALDGLNNRQTLEIILYGKTPEVGEFWLIKASKIILEEKKKHPELAEHFKKYDFLNKYEEVLNNGNKTDKTKV